MVNTVIGALCTGIMCAVCYRIGWNKGYKQCKTRYAVTYSRNIRHKMYTIAFDMIMRGDYYG